MNLRPLIAAAIAALCMVTVTRAEPLAVGAEAPRLTATDHDGKTVNLGELYPKGYVLVYFYPKADTRGCTDQACSLRDAYETLTARGVTVIGVSTDTVEAQKAFHDKYSLPFILLADPDRKIVNAFGVPLRRETMASRQAFLIKGGKVVWNDLEASTVQQAADVLAAIDALGQNAG